MTATFRPRVALRKALPVPWGSDRLLDPAGWFPCVILQLDGRRRIADYQCLRSRIVRRRWRQRAMPRAVRHRAGMQQSPSAAPEHRRQTVMPFGRRSSAPGSGWEDGRRVFPEGVSGCRRRHGGRHDLRRARPDRWHTAVRTDIRRHEDGHRDRGARHRAGIDGAMPAPALPGGCGVPMARPSPATPPGQKTHGLQCPSHGGPRHPLLRVIK